MLLMYSTTKAKRALCDEAQFVAQHFDHCNDAIVVDKSTDHAKPHFDLFFTTISTSKKMFLFRAGAEKGIA